MKSVQTLAEKVYKSWIEEELERGPITDQVFIKIYNKGYRMCRHCHLLPHNMAQRQHTTRHQAITVSYQQNDRRNK